MWGLTVIIALLAAATFAIPANGTEVVLQNGTTHGPDYQVSSLNSSSDGNRTADSGNKTESVTTMATPETTVRIGKTIEPCNATICEEKICRVNGSISRPSFYARCPSPDLLENEQDLSKYCMCASAYHAAPIVTESGETRPSYITITPDVNCDVPISDLEKSSCEQEKCQGVSKKSNRLAHICQVNDKFYCACFN
ncbi:unnamed protein product [Allacma fusca]|uniref:Uncharacterized protein n=1 Tax=Allacma fusca TaxID=39272 RepID=A0A8J2JQ72_9HEXA|nr:unnamed protein product [Allacma fusca]